MAKLWNILKYTTWKWTYVTVKSLVGNWFVCMSWNAFRDTLRLFSYKTHEVLYNTIFHKKAAILSQLAVFFYAYWIDDWNKLLLGVIRSTYITVQVYRPNYGQDHKHCMSKIFVGINLLKESLHYFSI